MAGQRHPPFYKAIDCFQKDYAKAKMDLVKHQMGTPLKTRVRREVVQYNNNLFTLCDQYRQGRYVNDIHRYLRRVSHNIRF